jgi:hypothetical protein
MSKVKIELRWLLPPAEVVLDLRPYGKYATSKLAPAV